MFVVFVCFYIDIYKFIEEFMKIFVNGFKDCLCIGYFLCILIL